MATKKKMLQAAAGNAGGGAGLNVEDVFSTTLYTGTSPSTQTITNNINLSDDGGLVWLKSRTQAQGHSLFDTERGANELLQSDLTATSQTVSNRGVTAFNSNGFDLGGGTGGNRVSNDYASWTFRKAPKFFDVVTYTGNGVSGRTVSHNLGTTPGFILVKSTSSTEYWAAYHTSLGANYSLRLNDTLAASESSGYVWGSGAGGSVEPTSTNFTVYNDGAVNGSGTEYVAYLFAHNDGDGGFGPDGDADIIKCGSFTTDGSGNATVDLGFEPQFVINKTSSSADSWTIADSMRGFNAIGDQRLYANLSNAETTATTYRATSTGFTVNGGETSKDFIYIAIRRGTKVPESGTEVFAVNQQNSSEPYWISNFPVDFQFVRRKDASDSWYSSSRLLQGKELVLNSTAAEGGANIYQFDYMNGWGASSYASAFSWMWKRAPGYFDAVAYTGDGVAGRTVSHNLTVAPEMMWIKCRSAAESWAVYHAGITNPEQNYLYLDESSALNPNANTIKYWNNTNPTDSVFTVGIEDRVNGSGKTYIAYLFASLPGISKVGSYAGNDGTQTIDCGFTSGARFILIKKTDGSDWFVWDTERGINAASDPFLTLNTTDAESSGQDEIDAHASGFIINSPGGAGDAEINKVGKTYIFYAIA